MSLPVLEDEFIRSINEDARTYKAKVNSFFEGWTLTDAQSVLYGGDSGNSLDTCEEAKGDAYLPERFNFQKKHLFCSSPVFTQKQCSSSHAAAPVTAFNDRYCMMNNGLKKFDGSVQHPLSCNHDSQGCAGGSLSGTY